MKYIVYKTTNIINNKIYIGVHRTNPDIFDGYIGCDVTYKDKKKTKLKGFPAAVRKYGYSNFKRETLYEYPDTIEGHDAAYKKEKELVNLEFIKSKSTYNLALGGKFTIYENIKKIIAQYTLDGKFIRTWDSIQEAQNALNLSSISQCLLGKSKYCGDFQWGYYTNTQDILPVTKKEKAVYQFDLSGNLLKVWKSITEASKLFKSPNSARVSITNVCNGVMRQAYGYYWSFKNKFNFIPYMKTQAVARYDDSGKFLESYTSLQDAAKDLNLKSTASITHAIQGKQKRAANYRWRFFYGNTCDIKSL